MNYATNVVLNVMCRKGRIDEEDFLACARPWALTVKAILTMMLVAVGVCMGVHYIVLYVRNGMLSSARTPNGADMHSISPHARQPIKTNTQAGETHLNCNNQFGNNCTTYAAHHMVLTKRQTQCDENECARIMRMLDADS